MLFTRLLAAGCLVLLPACTLEDHTPAGSRRDEAQIREVIVEFYRGIAAQDWDQVRGFFAPEGKVSLERAAAPDTAPVLSVVPADSALALWARLAESDSATGPGEARVIRADLRQADGVAAVWVSVRLDAPLRRRAAAGGSTETEEHLVLHRTADGWRIVLLALPWTHR